MSNLISGTRAQLLELAELNRRERPSVGTQPVSGVEDYGSLMVDIERAAHHLKESLPSGQRARTVAAVVALCEAARDLQVYLDAAGYLVVPEPTF